MCLVLFFEGRSSSVMVSGVSVPSDLRLSHLYFALQLGNSEYGSKLTSAFNDIALERE